MFHIIFAVVLLCVGIGAIMIASSMKKDGASSSTVTGTRIGGAVSMLLALLVVGSSILYIVPTQQIGIPVTFGKPHSAQTNGIHIKLPWTKIVDMDGTMQYIVNEGDRRTEIRLENQSVAYVQNTVNWRIRPEAADRLYRDHKEFQNISGALVEKNLKVALNEAFKGYNPLNTVSGDKVKDLNTIAADVKASLEKTIGDRVIIDQVMIPKVDFDTQTQSRIDAYQTEIGNTRIAEQKKKTATAEAAANRILASSVSKDSNVLVSKCLDQMGEMVNKGQAIPAGFSCWPGGSGTAVIANASNQSTQAPGK